MVSSGILWSRFYFILLALRFCCVVFAWWAFKNYEEDSSATLLTALEITASRQNESQSKTKELKLALKNKVTIFGALFIFAYQVRFAMPTTISSLTSNRERKSQSQAGSFHTSSTIEMETRPRSDMSLLDFGPVSHLDGSFLLTLHQELANSDSWSDSLSAPWRFSCWHG